MKIEKIQNNRLNYKHKSIYYNRARDAMYDIVNILVKKGYKKIYIPGYIGWSPREGSGIFDPINSITSLSRCYYRMTRDLMVDINHLKNILDNDTIVLLVNYFGFRDEKIEDIIKIAHMRNCIVLEDNAHGFFSYFCEKRVNSDFTFFSLHKMFPFEKGGSLILNNKCICENELSSSKYSIEPFYYDINVIKEKRKDNFRQLYEIVESYSEYFYPLKKQIHIENNVPQSFPIIINKGDRDKIYEMMNKEGYGVVSLYHTMIKELQNEKFDDSLWLSKKILNLPCHQDCDTRLYKKMIEKLVFCCDYTS